MSNISKRIKTTNESSPSWSSLPDAVALSCLAHVPRRDYATVSLVSRRHRSLVASPELCLTRSLIGCTEPYLYVCLHIVPEPTPRWFVLTRNRRLEPITSNPDQPLQSSSFVVVDWGIYVIGGIISGRPTSDVWFLDCYSRTWRCLPSMKMARASASASFVDGKIYVFGGCGEVADSSEVFDPQTQTWSEFVTPNDIHHSVDSVVKENKKVVYDDGSFLLIEYFLRRIIQDSVPEPGNRNDWCAIGNLLYCIGSTGRILWCEPDELDWKEVKGLKKRQSPFPANSTIPLPSTYRLVGGAETIKLCGNSAGNIVIFSKTLHRKNSRLCSEEISLERREGGEIWGKTEWFGTVFQLDPLSLASSFKAYYGGGGTPNPFFPSPSPHPYMWSAQHHMMPPYGTPVPYPAMYPPGAVYALPSMPMPPSSGPTNKETAKDQASGKKSKGNLKRKGEGGEKAPSGSGNDGVSQRCDLYRSIHDESVTAGSSDENDETANHQEQGSVRKPSFGQMLADASTQSNTTGELVPMKPVAPGTNLNIGMDLWSSQAGVAVKDERELKRQKRKQSNRESARRSRLRKQAECEQLQQRVESLTNENQSLRDELQRLSGECEKLKTENNSIQDELLRVHGPEAVASLEQNAAGSKDGEGRK